MNVQILEMVSLRTWIPVAEKNGSINGRKTIRMYDFEKCS